MKKTLFRCLSLTLACLLALAPALGAAESDAVDSPLFRLYEAGKALLSEEENFTVSAEATLLLDGEQFKHAAGLYAQEGTSCYQQIDLQSPRRYGSGQIRENGYAVIDLNGFGYSIETYLGKDHVTEIGNAPKNHALRPSISSLALLDLGQDAAMLMDQQAGDTVSAVRSADGIEIDLEWDAADCPALFNSLLNLFFQAAAERYLSVQYRDMPVEGYAAIEDYFTLTEGILYTVRNLAVQNLKLSAVLDDADRLERLNVSASLQLLCRNWDVRELTADIYLNAGDYGSTVVMEVVPEDKRVWTGAVPASGDSAFPRDAGWEEAGLSFPVLPAEGLSHEAITSPDEAVAYAERIAALGFLATDGAEQLLWSASRAGNQYELTGSRPESPDQPAFSLLFDHQGQVLRLENLETRLDLAQEIWSDEMDSDLFISWREELGFSVWKLEELLNPGATLLSAEELREGMSHGVGYTSYEKTLSSGDEQFEVLYGILHREPTQKVKYIVQTRPVVRLVLRDATIDPSEGGNG